MRSTWSLLWAARFVARWEGFVAHAYRDIVGVLTIGYGHTGKGFLESSVWSRAYALEILAKDLRAAAAAVARNIHVPLTVRQRIALISLVFNCGEGAVNGSELQAKLNHKNYAGAADEFLEWSHAGGVVVEGLLNRRKEERWMFLHNKRRGKNPHRHDHRKKLPHASRAEHSSKSKEKK